MGIYDRDYTQQDSTTWRGSSFGLPTLSRVVMWLLIINVAMFIVPRLSAGLAGFVDDWLPIDTTSAAAILQPWRLITYQFLHADFMHILFNMLGLYFLGPTLERHWGPRRFTAFYISCGAAGGLFYTLLSSLHVLRPGDLIGASGSVLGMLAACAILFPHFVVFIFVFPVPIRIAAIIFIVMYIFNVVMGGQNAGGDAAHLAGMAAGAAYVFASPLLERMSMRRKSSQWERKMEQARDLQTEVDRILEKVHNSGIQSLTRSEKRTLEEATRLEQMRNRL